MSTVSSANVTDVNLVLKERTHMRLCINMLIFTLTHNLGNWLMGHRTVLYRPVLILAYLTGVISDNCKKNLAVYNAF